MVAGIERLATACNGNQSSAACATPSVNMESRNPPLQPKMNTDGADLYFALWKHFLVHEPIVRWLMNYGPDIAPQTKDFDRSLSFCCDFVIPSKWNCFKEAFAMGEMFLPTFIVGRFVCGSVVTATAYHKHAVCASRLIAPHATIGKGDAGLQSTNRRMVCDMGAGDAVNIIEFAWMHDGSLNVTTKILIPPCEGLAYQ